MSIYLLFFGIISAMALGYGQLKSLDQQQTRLGTGNVIFFGLSGVIVFLFVGGSTALGCDWEAYQRFFNEAINTPLASIISGRDPGFFVLNWIAYQIGGNDYGPGIVQAFVGLIFTAGLIAFCMRLPQGQDALVAALPYLVIVVSIGFTRQAVALGCLMLVLVVRGNSWPKLSVKAFLLLLGVSFHIPFAPIAAILCLTFGLKRWQWIVALGAAAISAFIIIDAQQFIHTIRFYLDPQYDENAHSFSTGAFYRVPLIAAGAAVWLTLLSPFLKERTPWSRHKTIVWPSINLLAFFALLLPIFLPFLSTVTDRYAVYLSCVLLAVIGYRDHLPQPLNNIVQWSIYPTALILLISWLWFSTFSQCWMPYQTWLLS